jgi:hypothetical protein
MSVKRLVAAFLLAYVMLALYYRAREAAGFMTCDCYPDCWCRKPGLSIFRWVFPRYHHNLWVDAWKEQHPEESR